MQNKKYLELDALAAPNGYVAPPTKEDLAYVVHFRKTCQRYQIDFAKADPDERDFVIHMAEKTFFQKRADRFVMLLLRSYAQAFVEHI